MKTKLKFCKKIMKTVGIFPTKDMQTPTPLSFDPVFMDMMCKVLKRMNNKFSDF